MTKPMHEQLNLYIVDVEKVLNDNNIKLPLDNKDIMRKDTRPYYVPIKLDNNYSAFIPIRTNLRHGFGFTTKKNNSTKTKSGLDYTKSLIVESKKVQDYLIKAQGISFSEYLQIEKHQTLINKTYKEFIFKKFIPILQTKETDRTPEEKRIHNFSALQYFVEPLNEIQKERMKRIKRKSVTQTKQIRRDVSSRPKQKQAILEQIQQAERSSAKKNRQNTPHSRTKNHNKER